MERKENNLFVAKIKMSLSKPGRKKQSLGPRKLTFILPREVWIYIWGFLDFETLQKECTLVSKTWFNEIRDSTNLSGKMTLKRSWNLDMRNLNKILAHWKKLKELFVASEETSRG